jgi:hypothetical protein
MMGKHIRDSIGALGACASIAHGIVLLNHWFIICSNRIIIAVHIKVLGLWINTFMVNFDNDLILANHRVLSIWLMPGHWKIRLHTIQFVGRATWSTILNLNFIKHSVILELALAALASNVLCYICWMVDLANGRLMDRRFTSWGFTINI